MSRARRVVVLVAALATAVLTARLGVWQWNRAGQKEAIQAAIDARALLPAVGAAGLAATARDGGASLMHRQVRVRGHWLAGATIFLENRVMDERTGFFVVTPLQFAGGVVLVQRGWAPRDPADRTRLPVLANAPGEVEVVGRIAPPPSRLYEFSAAVSGSIRQNLDIGEYAREIGLALLPVTVLEQGTPESDPALRRDWLHPAANADKNYGYAVQWWAMSFTIIGLYVWYQLVRPRLRKRAG